ncbi:MAG: hypothetical protein MJ250_01225 [Alphaproteobacteria bacterium]|nr:hypothetical protein [Alphaproteobacteria bacterium]
MEKIILPLLFLTTLFGSFIIQGKVNNLEKQIQDINFQKKENLKEIHILEAEWAFLSNPDRIQKLAKILQMKQIKGEQLISFSSLPDRVNKEDVGIIPVAYVK